jgi:hypothetical protein
MKEVTREQTIADARMMLDWFESHPNVPLPYEMQTGRKKHEHTKTNTDV